MVLNVVFSYPDCFIRFYVSIIFNNLSKYKKTFEDSASVELELQYYTRNSTDIDEDQIFTL